MRKSSPDRYGTVVVSIHWISVMLVLALLGSGFLAANAGSAAAQAGFLRFHVPAGIALLALTIARALWWRVDRRPGVVAGTFPWRERIARGVHRAFYVVIVLMAASGIGMLAAGGAFATVFGGPGASLPDFDALPPRLPHGAGAWLLIALFVLHGGAALYHTFVRRDGLLSRMWYRG